MPLGYRALFSVPTNPEPISLVQEQVRSWLRGKGLHAELPEIGRSQVGPDSVLTVLHKEHSGDSVSWRARLREANAVGRWVVTATAHREPAGAWIQMDVDAPADHDGSALFTAVPTVVRHLLDVLPARDSHAILGSRPRIADTEDVDELIDAICDPQRRSLLLVAGTHPDLPLQPWTELVSTIMAQSIGMVAGYVLTPAATELLGEQLGVSHATRPGTIRTYLPDADPASFEDARRHRWLGTATLASSDERRLARNLGRVYRQRIRELVLPSQVQRLGRALDELEVELASEGLLVDATTPSAPPTHPEQVDADAGPSPAFLDDTAVFLRLQQLDLIPATVGPQELDQALASLSSQLSRASRDALAVASLREVVTDRQEATLGTETQLGELQKQFDDTQLDLAEADQERRAQAEKIRRLEAELAAANPVRLGDVLVQDTTDTPPESYTALIAALRELPHIRFTGDEDVTIGLSVHDPADTFIGRIWDALRALNDYARARTAGAIDSGGLHSYLNNTPPGYRSWPATKYAATESDTTRNDRRLARLREFPVPEEVSSAGWIEMWAHLKIAQRGQVSPRLHFHDGTGSTGLVYVGYIGPHLETRATN